MVTEFYESPSFFRLDLRAIEEDYPRLLDISAFLYDFNLLYEIARLAVDPHYDSFRFNPRSPFTTLRRGRPLLDRDRLFVEGIRLESPLELILIVAAVPGAVAAIWGIVQTVEKIYNMPLNRRKLRAEVEKLERENAIASKQSKEESHIQTEGTTVSLPEHLIKEYLNSKEEGQFEQRLLERGAMQNFRRVETRLVESKIKITHIEVDVIERVPEK